MHRQSMQQSLRQEGVERGDVRSSVRVNGAKHLTACGFEQFGNLLQESSDDLLAVEFGGAEDEDRVSRGDDGMQELHQRKRGVSGGECSEQRAVHGEEFPLADQVFGERGLGVREEEELCVQPASHGRCIGERGGETDHLQTRVQEAQFEQQQLDEIPSVGVEGLRLVDDDQVDARLLRLREGRGTTWPSRIQRLTIRLAFSTVLMAIYDGVTCTARHRYVRPNAANHWSSSTPRRAGWARRAPPDIASSPRLEKCREEGSDIAPSRRGCDATSGSRTLMTCPHP